MKRATFGPPRRRIPASKRPPTRCASRLSDLRLNTPSYQGDRIIYPFRKWRAPALLKLKRREACPIDPVGVSYGPVPDIVIDNDPCAA